MATTDRSLVALRHRRCMRVRVHLSNRLPAFPRVVKLITGQRGFGAALHLHTRPHRLPLTSGHQFSRSAALILDGQLSHKTTTRLPFAPKAALAPGICPPLPLANPFQLATPRFPHHPPTPLKSSAKDCFRFAADVDLSPRTAVYCIRQSAFRTTIGHGLPATFSPAVHLYFDFGNKNQLMRGPFSPLFCGRTTTSSVPLLGRTTRYLPSGTNPRRTLPLWSATAE